MDRGPCSSQTVYHAPVAVVWRRPDRYQLVVEHPLVPVHHQLVSAADEADLVVAAEVLAHITTKQVASTTRAQAPPLDVLCSTAQHSTTAARVSTPQGAGWAKRRMSQQ